LLDKLFYGYNKSMTEDQIIQAFYEDINKEPDYPEKSVGWYVNQYPEPYRSQALKNIELLGNEGALYALNKHELSIREFLPASFYTFAWAQSPQGREYWQDFFDTYQPWKNYD
jgi:hypothetical protein